MKASEFQELLAKAKAHLALSAEKKAADILLAEMITNKTEEVDLTKLDIQEDTPEELKLEVIQDVISGLSERANEATISNETHTTKTYSTARHIILNAKQSEFNQRVQTGEDTVLIGAAGTGKTTSMRQVGTDLIESGRITPLRQGTKWLTAGNPGAAILSYTRKAVNNIRHAVPESLKGNTLTIHKILEFAPIYYQIEDPVNKGIFKNTMRFEPTRTRDNPLPSDLIFIAFEESSMISVALYNLLQDAMPHAHQEIFLGDIQQLPPIFGSAILGFKMLEIPVIELTEVYRQALESPIISLAWKILEGNPHVFSPNTESYKTYSSVLNKEVTRIRVPALANLEAEGATGTVKIQPWQKTLSPDNGTNTVIKQFCSWSSSGYYNSEEDIILCPFNKSFGTIELNKGISQHLGLKREAIVHEIIAGFNKHYLAVGDRVLYDKEDAVIVGIALNGAYLGARFQAASVNLDRWGHYQAALSEEEILAARADADYDLEAIEKLMEAAADQIEDRKQSASHIITIKLTYEEEERVLESASDINNLLGGYALTVHKFQGSENERVFLILHNSHATMISRELLYTAVTRARSFLHIICEIDTFYKGLQSQRIKGDTWQQKAETFKGKKQKDEEEMLPSTHAKLASSAGETKVTTISGKKAIKLADIVPDSIRDDASQEFMNFWEAAKVQYPVLKEVAIPDISFELNRKHCLGLARFKTNTIHLNPIWCTIAAEDGEVWQEMLETTLRHEACHFIAWRIYKDPKHGFGWRAVMETMGEVPAVTYDGEVLPPWAAAKDALLRKILGTVEEQPTDEPINETDDLAVLVEAETPKQADPLTKLKQLMALRTVKS